MQSQRSTSAARERILDTASELFYERGIQTVGVDTVIAAAGVAKMTLYRHFYSKEELVAAYLARRDARLREWFEEKVISVGAPARERLLMVFDALGKWFASDEFHGCGFINAYAKLADLNHPARAVVLEQKRWLRYYLAELVREAGAEDPENMAERLLILHEGATVAESMGTANGSVRKAREIAAGLTSGL